MSSVKQTTSTRSQTWLLAHRVIVAFLLWGIQFTDTRSMVEQAGPCRTTGGLSTKLHRSLCEAASDSVVPFDRANIHEQRWPLIINWTVCSYTLPVVYCLIYQDDKKECLEQHYLISSRGFYHRQLRDLLKNGQQCSMNIIPAYHTIHPRCFARWLR